MPFPDISEWYTPSRIDAEEPLWRSSLGYAVWAEKIKHICIVNGLSTVLEVGCGTGWVPYALNSFVSYTGVDKNPHMLERCRAKNPRDKFVQCDLRDVKSQGLSADLVCGFGVLKHFGLHEWRDRLSDFLGLGRFSLFTFQIFMDGRASEDIPGGYDEQHLGGFHGIWINRNEFVQAVEKEKHEIIEFNDRLLFNEGIGAPEAVVVTRRMA